MWILPLT
jgi:hypothetical protein